MVMPIFYIPASGLVQKVPTGVKKSAILMLASLLSFVASLFVGPSLMLGFGNSLPLMVVG